MLNQLRSYWNVAVIFVQKILDIINRFVFGLPSLRRCQITADLFLGSQYNLVGLNKLKRLGITAIVNMRIHSVYPAARFEGIKYLHLPTLDNTPPLLEDLFRGSAFIEEEINRGGKVYVHCREGLGRGPTMAISYLIRKGLTLDDALKLVKSVRTFVHPRLQQIEKLKEFENLMHGIPQSSVQ